MRLSASPLALLACAALAPAAAAQATFPTFTDVPGTVNPLGALAVGAVGTPVLTDLTGDGVPDLLLDPAEVTIFPSAHRNAPLAALFGPDAAPARPSASRGGGTDFLFFEGVQAADGRVGFAPADANPFADLATDASSEQLSSPALADLDGDGDLDLVALASFDLFARLVYFENVGTAGAPVFAYRTDNPLADAPPGFLTFADADADGDADLFSMLPAESGAQLLYFQNVGTPQSAAFEAADSPFGDAAFPVLTFAPAFLDADGDGDLDAAIGGVDLGESNLPAVRLFENVGAAGAPSFVLAAEQPFADLGTNPFIDEDTAAPAAADLDGDGDPDLAVVLGAGPYPRSLYFENQSTPGTVAFEQEAGLGNPVRFAALVTSGGDTPIYAPATSGDLDADGDLDLVFGITDYGPLLYAENVGTATDPLFRLREGAASPFSAFPFDGLTSATLADLDADGDLDAVVSALFEDDGPGQIVYLENVGTPEAPAFAERAGANDPFATLLNGLAPAGTAFADLDADGDLDLVLATLDLNAFAAALRYAENVGTADAPLFALAAPGTGPLPAPDGAVLAGPTLADLDGDGDFDLVVAEPRLESEIGLGAVRVFQNVGTPEAAVFAERTGAPALFGGEVPLPSRLALADFDADGDVDAFSPVATSFAFGGAEEIVGSQARYFLNNGDARVGAEPTGGPRAGLALGDVYPNPLTGAAQLRLALGRAQQVTAEAFDALGRRVAVLHDGVLPAGTDHVLRFDAAALPAGLYVVRVQSAGDVAVRRVTKL